MVENASISMTTATAGLFTAAGGAGTTIAADQALAALTASSKILDLTLQAVTGTDVLPLPPCITGLAQPKAQRLPHRCGFWLEIRLAQRRWLLILIEGLETIPNMDRMVRAVPRSIP